MTKTVLGTKSAEQTMNIARDIGKNLRGGECIELQSDVGCGKTTFVRGLVHGTGSKSHVASPTFTISKLYKAPKFEILHFDFYRLQDAGLIAYEVEEAVHDPTTVIVVEWSDIIQHVLPEERLIINIKAPSEHEREFTLSYPAELEYLVKDIA